MTGRDAVVTTVDTSLGALEVRVHGSGPVAALWHSLFVDDRSWTAADAEEAAARMPDADVAVVAGSGHLTPFETPAETISLVMRLWDHG